MRPFNGRLPSSAILILALIVVVGTLLRFHGLGKESFWFNEAASYHYAKGTLRDVVLHSFRDETNPPGFHLLIHFWKSVAGIGERALRVPSAVAGSATLLLMYAFARRFVGRRGALLATALLAFAPLHVWYSQECRGFAFLTLFVLAAYTSAFRWQESGRSRYLAINAVALVCAVAFHYFAVHALLIQNLYFVVTRPPIFRMRWRSYLLAQGLVCLCLVPFAWMMLSVDVTNVQWWRESGVRLGVLKSLFFHLNGVYFLLEKERALKAAILLLNAVAFAAGCLALHRQRRLLFPLLAIALPCLLNLLYSLIVSPILGNAQSAGRYFLFTLPPFLVVIASGWHLVLASRRLRGVAVAGCVGFFLLTIGALSAMERNTVFQRDDNRRLCARLLSEARPGDLVIVSPFITLDYYLDLLGRRRAGLRIVALPRFAADPMRYLPPDIPRTWVFVDPLRRFLPFLEDVKRRYGMSASLEETERKMSGVGLFLLEKRSGHE